MVTKSKYEEELLKEVQDLSDSELPKIIKLVHFLKEEILGKGKLKEDKDSKLFWESFGSWKDHRTAEEIIKDIYESRKSSKREMKL